MPRLWADPMPRTALTGTRIRERRTMLGIKQADLARSAEISPSYLNLIEHNRRRIGGALLGRIAQVLEVEVGTLTEGAGPQLQGALVEAASSFPDLRIDPARIDDFVGRFPDWAALVTSQARLIAGLERRIDTLVDRLGHDPDLQEALHHLISKVSAVRATAAILTETEGLEEGWRRRFERNLQEDSAKLSDGAAALAAMLDAEAQQDRGPLTPQEELEEYLNAVHFHLAALEGSVPELIETLVGKTPYFSSEPARERARAYLARYRAEAGLLPLRAVAKVAEETGWDPLALASHFGAPVTAVLRRLAGLPQTVAGPGPAYIVADGAGALTLRRHSDLLPVPRFGPGCPLWPLYEALSRPNQLLRVAIAHPAEPSRICLAYAYAERRQPLGLEGPAVTEAAMLVLPPAVAPPTPAAGTPVPVGTSCRVCPRPACPARREPSLLAEDFDRPADPAP